MRFLSLPSKVIVYNYVKKEIKDTKETMNEKKLDLDELESVSGGSRLPVLAFGDYCCYVLQIK